MNDEKEYNEFMVKMVQKSLEINDDYNKLSSNNQKRISQDMQMLFNAMYVANDFAIVESFKNRFLK